MSITIKCYPFGPLGENTYLITDEATGSCAVIDPGYLIPSLDIGCGDASSLKYILLTHGHYDHFAAADKYLNDYPDAVFAAPAAETYLLHGGRDNKWMALNNGRPGICPEAHLLLKEGDTIDLGQTVIRVIETPGHTEGGICFVTDREVFTGDTLFRLSVGNTSLETGNWETLVESIRSKLYTLDEDMIAYPGHGQPTTIGYEKRANPFV